MIYELPPLPYGINDLAPVISQETIEYHYGKHEQTYIDNLNKLIEGTPFADKPLEEIIKEADGALFNNASQAWTTLFGSGWVWLSKDKDGNLVISKENNAGTPLTKGLTPLLTFDVWEHAYYIDYRNRRAEQLHNLWKIVDWSVVESRYL